VLAETDALGRITTTERDKKSLLGGLLNLCYPRITIKLSCNAF